MRRIPILMLAAALPLAAQQYDLLIQGGRIIDPANGIDAVMITAGISSCRAQAQTGRADDVVKSGELRQWWLDEGRVLK